jgi:imidazolonepropionase-like amidohydrolase
MQRLNLLASCLAIALVSSRLLLSQSHPQNGPVLFDGARLIVGDGSRSIESGAFVVQNGRVTAVGRTGALTPPAGATRVDLTGKTVMPALINVHVHIGYEGYTSWGAANYTPQNVLDHLPARGVLRRRCRTVGRQQPDRSGDQVSTGPDGREVSTLRAISLHAGHGAS